MIFSRVTRKLTFFTSQDWETNEVRGKYLDGGFYLENNLKEDRILMKYDRLLQSDLRGVTQILPSSQIRQIMREPSVMQIGMLN